MNVGIRSTRIICDSHRVFQANPSQDSPNFRADEDILSGRVAI